MYLPCDNFSPGESAYFKRMEQEQDVFTERLRKSLYFGQLPGTDRPSLPLTDLAVKYYQEAAPKELGKLDHFWAASTARAACMTPASMVAGMMYVKRLKTRKSEYLAQISSSDLFLISVMMASKFLYDEGVDEEVFNDEWATSGNLDVEDVNELEREFLSAIDWHLFVQPEEFKNTLNRIEKRIAFEQGRDRGWFSYTDIELLSRDFSLRDLCDQQIKQLAQVFGVSTLAYIASILTMVGSTIMATTASSALVHFGSTTLPHVARLVPATYPFRDLTLLTTSDEFMLSGDFDSLENEVQNKDYCNGTGVDVHHTEDAIEKGSQDGVKGAEHLHDEIDVITTNKHRDSGLFISGFLSPLLALVTLKDTIMKFSKTFMDQEPEDVEDVDILGETVEFCSDGPCLLDSWPDCWNVSSEHDWSAFKSRQAREMAGLNNGHKGFESHLNNHFDQVLGTGGCCCKNSAGPGTFIKHGLHYRYVDSFNIGFTTASAFPIYVT